MHQQSCPEASPGMRRGSRLCCIPSASPPLEEAWEQAGSAPAAKALLQEAALKALQPLLTLLLTCEPFISAALLEKLNHRGESEG